MMRIRLSEPAIKQYRNLSPVLKRKVDKQFVFLLSDFRHPSLHAKKYHHNTGLWQARVDRDWRFYFYVVEPHYVVVTIIKHPK